MLSGMRLLSRLILVALLIGLVWLVATDSGHALLTDAFTAPASAGA